MYAREAKYLLIFRQFATICHQAHFRELQKVGSESRFKTTSHMGNKCYPGNLFTGLNYKSFLGRIFILEKCLVRCCIWPQTAGLFNHLVSFISIATYLIHSVYLTSYLLWKRRNNMHIYIYVGVCVSKYVLRIIYNNTYLYIQVCTQKICNVWCD